MKILILLMTVTICKTNRLVVFHSWSHVVTLFDFSTKWISHFVESNLLFQVKRIKLSLSSGCWVDAGRLIFSSCVELVFMVKGFSVAANSGFLFVSLWFNNWAQYLSLMPSADSKIYRFLFKMSNSPRLFKLLLSFKSFLLIL